jgi:hypothetical protein
LTPDRNDLNSRFPKLTMSESNSNSSRFPIWRTVIALTAGLLLLVQYQSIAALRVEVEALRSSQSAANAPKGRVTRAARPASGSSPTTIIMAAGDVEDRVAVLEEHVALLGKNAAHLMDRGQVPPDAEKIAEWKERFLNPDTPFKSMYGALKLLRANKEFDDAMAAHAAQMLSSSTNNGIIRALLDGVRGINSPALKPALLALAAESNESSIRSRAILGLREFAADDPSVEAALWEIAKGDESKDVRARAEDALRRVPMTETRQAMLTQQVANAGLPFDERWSALRILGGSKNTDITQLAASLAQTSQTTTDPESQLAYLKAFDDVNHPEFMLPLVKLVQSENAEVRLRAADALVDYKGMDPNVIEWLKVLAESDPDPRVRKEATRAFRGSKKPQKRERR